MQFSNLIKLYAPVSQRSFGIWNIPWDIPWNIPRNIPWNMKMSKVEYSKNNLQQQKYVFFGIWNIPGILKKKVHNEILEILEYGISQE